jgi:hypothetical protein
VLLKGVVSLLQHLRDSGDLEVTIEVVDGGVQGSLCVGLLDMSVMSESSFDKAHFYPLREYSKIFKHIQAYSKNIHIFLENISRICLPNPSNRTSLPLCPSFITTMVGW